MDKPRSRSKSPKSKVPKATDLKSESEFIPTKSQLKTAAINEIVDDAMKSVDKPVNDIIDADAYLMASMKNIEKHKTVPVVEAEDDSHEFAKLHKLYRGFRMEYEGKITWNFKPDDRLLSMKSDILKKELDVIRTLVNSQYTPGIFESVIEAIAFAVEKVSMKYPSQYTILHKLSADNMSFSETVKLNIDQGYFKPEIDQLIIEYGSWFAAGPETRIAMKMMRMAKTVADDNKLTIQHLQSNSKVSKENYGL